LQTSGKSYRLVALKLHGFDHFKLPPFSLVYLCRGSGNLAGKPVSGDVKILSDEKRLPNLTD